jgi:serine/threonine protein phosphatase PrpC
MGSTESGASDKRASGLVSGGGLPLRKQSQEPALKFVFKHEIMSMDGFNPEYDKTNQDYSHHHKFVSGKETTKLFLLADGHGPHGHYASKKAIELLCQLVEQKVSARTEAELTEEAIRKILAEGYEHIQLVFASDEDNSFKYSGTTMLTALIRKGLFFLANAGDSRGFLASKVGPHLVPSVVSVDHKPDCPTEKARIEKAGGFVGPYLEADNTPNGPPRVWSKGRKEPGLATSRTLGDITGHQIGVSHAPGTAG